MVSDHLMQHVGYVCVIVTSFFKANHFEEINVSFVAPLRPGTAKASQAHPHCALLSGASKQVASHQ